jgi:hypothetical protein
MHCKHLCPPVVHVRKLRSIDGLLRIFMLLWGKTEWRDVIQTESLVSADFCSRLQRIWRGIHLQNPADMFTGFSCSCKATREHGTVSCEIHDSLHGDSWTPVLSPPAIGIPQVTRMPSCRIAANALPAACANHVSSMDSLNDLIRPRFQLFPGQRDV